MADLQASIDHVGVVPAPFPIKKKLSVTQQFLFDYFAVFLLQPQPFFLIDFDG
jgi:hypothetical protein